MKNLDYIDILLTPRGKRVKHYFFLAATYFWKKKCIEKSWSHKCASLFKFGRNSAELRVRFLKYAHIGNGIQIKIYYKRIPNTLLFVFLCSYVLRKIYLNVAILDALAKQKRVNGSRAFNPRIQKLCSSSKRIFDRAHNTTKQDIVPTTKIALINNYSIHDVFRWPLQWCKELYRLLWFLTACASQHTLAAFDATY